MTPQQLKAMKLALEALTIQSDRVTEIGKKREAITAIEEVLAEHAMQEVQRLGQEPLEYWNAVEGWVKIDEVREHFDSVGCATIYKTAGEGRVPLSLAKAQPEQEPVACERCKQLEEQAYDLVGELRVANIKLSMRPQRLWVRLTAEEVLQCWEKAHEPGNKEHINAIRMADEVEAKLKEKNT